MNIEDVKTIRLAKRANKIMFVLTIEIKRAEFRKAIDTDFDQKELEVSIGKAIVRSLALADISSTK